ncbi:MAG: hypothetical protein IPM41_05350 [Sphingomonadales bacterium]|nr:hypothetical protein [Sphingomonadales bacterium]
MGSMVEGQAPDCAPPRRSDLLSTRAKLFHAETQSSAETAESGFELSIVSPEPASFARFESIHFGLGRQFQGGNGNAASDVEIRNFIFPCGKGGLIQPIQSKYLRRPLKVNNSLFDCMIVDQDVLILPEKLMCSM